MTPQTSQAISQGIDQLSSVIASNNITRKTMRWNEKMYNLQRQNALADWAMQNEYNSPRAQMQRFQEAGLNPHLIYGQQTTAQPVRNSDTKSISPPMPQFNNGSMLGNMYSLQQQKAQTDLLRTQNTVALQNASLIAARIAGEGIRNARSDLDLQIATELKNTSIESAKANLASTVAKTTFQLSENERREALTASNLQVAAERILLMRAQVANTDADRQRIYAMVDSIKKDNTIKDFEIQLRKQGIHPGSPWWIKTLETLLDGKTDSKIGQRIDAIIPKSPGDASRSAMPESAKKSSWYKMKF